MVILSPREVGADKLSGGNPSPQACVTERLVANTQRRSTVLAGCQASGYTWRSHGPWVSPPHPAPCSHPTQKVHRSCTARSVPATLPNSQVVTPPTLLTGWWSGYRLPTPSFTQLYTSPCVCVVSLLHTLSCVFIVIYLRAELNAKQ